MTDVSPSHLWPWVSCHSNTGRSFFKTPEKCFSASVHSYSVYDRMEVQLEITWNLFDQSLPSPAERNHSVVSALPWGRKTNKQVEHETSKETERKSGLLEGSPKSVPTHRRLLVWGRSREKAGLGRGCVCTSVVPLDVGMCLHIVSVEHLD